MTIHPVCPKAEELHQIVTDAFKAAIPNTLETIRKQILDCARLGYHQVEILEEDISGPDDTMVPYEDFMAYYYQPIVAWLATSDLKVTWNPRNKDEIEFDISWSKSTDNEPDDWVNE